VFFAQNVQVAGTPRIVGKDHLRFSVASGGSRFNAIAFRMGHRLLDISGPGKRLTLAFTIEENEWAGKTSIQFNIRGIL